MRLNGYVDLIEKGRAIGWAADLDEPTRPVQVAIIVDGQEIGRIDAVRPRPDLRRTHNALATDAHGFDFAWTANSTGRSRQEVRVLFADTRVQVSNGFAIVSDGVRRSPRPRYVVHIGPHKTGTKYLQTVLRERTDELAARGIVYPDRWSSPKDPTHAPFVSRLAGADPALTAELRELETEQTHVMVLSSEDFIDLGNDAVAFLSTLLHDAEVEIVFYCRRWSELLYSGWTEIVKHGSDLTLPEFVAAHASNPFGSTVINYALALDRFADAFGRSSLRLVSYNTLIEARIDLFRHFATTFLDWRDAPGDGRGINPSMEMREVELIRALNGLALTHGHPDARSMHPRYLERCPRLDLAALFAQMEQHLGELKVNEGVPGFSTLHNTVFEKYGDRVLPPCPASGFFQPQVKTLRYVRRSYLLSGEALAALKDTYQNLVS